MRVIFNVIIYHCQPEYYANTASHSRLRASANNTAASLSRHASHACRHCHWHFVFSISAGFSVSR